MSESIAGRHEGFVSSRAQSALASSAPSSYEAYQILHFGFVAAPVIAGIDKFLHLLVVTGSSRTGAAEHGVPLLTLRREDISLPIAWRSEADRAAAAAGNTSLSSIAM